MTRQLKVYGWTSERSDCPPAPNGSRQVRYIVATTSWVEAVAAAKDTKRGYGVTHAMRYGSVTGNDEQVRIAMAEPGVAFWIPLNDRYHPNAEWRRVAP